jgi:D-alanyl-D-alanine carboxypeptidase
MTATTPLITKANIAAALRMGARGTWKAATSPAVKNFGRASLQLLRRKDKVGRAARIASVVLGTFAAGEAVDRYVVGPALVKSGAVPDYSRPKAVKTPCFDPRAGATVNAAHHAQCQKTADDIIASVPKWDDAIAKLKQGGTSWAQNSIPGYIDVQLALMSAGIESNMGLAQGKGNTFEGLYQYSRTDTSSLLHTQKKYFLEILNASKGDIPVLAALNTDKITFDQLLSDPVFFDPTVQVFLKMTSSYINDEQMKKAFPRYADLPETNKVAIGYVSHLTPEAAKMLAKYPACSHPISSYTYQFEGSTYRLPAEFFKRNSGMYEELGRANPSEVASRFWEITAPFMAEFGSQAVARSWRWMPAALDWMVPHAGVPAKPVTFRPGQLGLASFVTGAISDYFGCNPAAGQKPKAASTEQRPEKGRSIKLPPVERAELVVEIGNPTPLVDINGDKPHPAASLTKLLALYVVFEELEAGRLRETDMITISRHANSMPPSRLAVPGNRISVHNSILATATRSANNIIVAIAEHISGDENTFVTRMNDTAHANDGTKRTIGMSVRSRFYNVSGLPSRLHTNMVTPKDMAILLEKLEKRFPQYMHYIDQQKFVFNGEEIRSHDHLSGKPGFKQGKTGYTRAAGFNVAQETQEIDGKKYIVVEMGYPTWAARDAQARKTACEKIPGFPKIAKKTCELALH